MHSALFAWLENSSDFFSKWASQAPWKTFKSRSLSWNRPMRNSTSPCQVSYILLRAKFGNVYSSPHCAASKPSTACLRCTMEHLNFPSWVSKQCGAWSEIWVPTLPFINYETLSNLLNIFELWYSHLKNRIIPTYRVVQGLMWSYAWISWQNDSQGIWSQ